MGHSSSIVTESSCEESFFKISNITKNEYDLIVFNTKDTECFAKLATDFSTFRDQTKDIFKILIHSNLNKGIHNTTIHNRHFYYHTDKNILQIKPDSFNNRELLEKIIYTFVINQPKIYISYGNDETHTARDVIDEFTELAKIAAPQAIIYDDRKMLKTSYNLKRFIKEIGEGDILMLIVNDKYFESPHAMEELYHAFKSIAPKKQIFPLIIKGKQDFHHPDGYNAIVQHWQEKLNENEAIKNKDIIQIENEEKIKNFIETIPKLKKYSTEFFTMPINVYKEQKYIEIFEEIRKKLSEQKEHISFYNNQDEIEEALDNFHYKKKN